MNDGCLNCGHSKENHIIDDLFGGTLACCPEPFKSPSSETIYVNIKCPCRRYKIYDD